FAGSERTLPLTVENTGTDLLTVGGALSADPAVRVVPASVAIPPRSSRVLEVTFAPSGPGLLASSLILSSDASNAPSLSVPVRGSAVPAPLARIAPSSLIGSLDTGDVATRSLRISNAGGSDLIVTLA